MITDHVPCVRLPLDCVRGLLASAVPPGGHMEGRRDLDTARLAAIGPHLVGHPQAKLAGGGGTSPARTRPWPANCWPRIDEISKIFWETKQG